MAETYLLIASRDPFESNDVQEFYRLAAQLQAAHPVTLFLVQNGVLAARDGTKANVLGELVKAGVKILADDFSLKERGISRDRLASGVASAPIGTVIDHLATGAKTIWS